MLESTPARLIATAERLYANDGIEQVSLRQIADAAGQRNPSAVQYHFGSKLELMRTIVRFRLPPYNERQLEMCAALDAARRSFDVRGLVEASLAPFALLEPADSSFVGFLAELMKDPERFNEVVLGVEPAIRSGAQLLTDRFDRALVRLDRPILELRLNLAINAGMSAIARSHALLGSPRPFPVSIDVLLADLVESISAFLEAPAPG